MKTEQKLLNEMSELRSKLDKIEDSKTLASNKKWAGKYLKCENSYGVDDDGKTWWLYRKVIKVGIYIESFQFQKTSTGRFEASLDEYTTGLDRYSEITEKEYNFAFSKFLSELKSIS